MTIWAEIRGLYGTDYNSGRRADMGAYQCDGHWENLARWRGSALGIAQAFEALAGEVPRSALDVGCGRGTLVRSLQEIGVPTIGVDLAEDIRYSRHCAIGNAIALPFAMRFDCLVALDLVEHVPADYQRTLLSELRRVCGRLMFATVPAEGETREMTTEHGVLNHYIVQAPDWWAAHFAEHGFELVAQGAELSRFGAPFAHGAANYPFALAVRAREN